MTVCLIEQPILCGANRFLVSQTTLAVLAVTSVMALASAVKRFGELSGTLCFNVTAFACHASHVHGMLASATAFTTFQSVTSTDLCLHFIVCTVLKALFCPCCMLLANQNLETPNQSTNLYNTLNLCCFTLPVCVQLQRLRVCYMLRVLPVFAMRGSVHESRQHTRAHWCES